MTSLWLFIFENDVNVPSKSNKQKNIKQKNAKLKWSQRNGFSRLSVIYKETLALVLAFVTCTDNNGHR